MPEPKTPDDSLDSPAEDPMDEFEKRLRGAYPDVDWTEQDKDFLRASGLI
jgi:hypothetical protein